MSRARRRRRRSIRNDFGKRDRVRVETRTSPGDKRLDAFFEFIEPYRGRDDDDESVKRLIEVCVMAWNLSQFPESEREEFLSSSISKAASGQEPELRDDPRAPRSVDRGEQPCSADRLSPDEQVSVMRLFHEMMERRIEHFAQHRRMIEKHKITERGDGLHLFVAWTPVA